MDNVLKIVSYAKIAGASEVELSLRKRVKTLLVFFRSEDSLGNIYRQAQERGFVELPSVYSNHKAKCSFSVYSAEKNFLRFVDRSGKFFYVIQNPRYFLHSVYLPEDNIIFSTISSKPKILQMLRSFEKDLQEFDDIGLVERNYNFLGVINGYSRPYHYFRDKVTTLLFLEEYLAGVSVLTLQDRAFLRADLINGGKESMVVGSLNAHLHKHRGFALDPAGSFSPSYRNNMDVAAASIWKKVHTKFESSDIATSIEGRSPVVWFGICSQKRIWINQNSTIASIIDAIVDEYPDALFVFDGLTATVGVDESEFRNTAAAAEIISLEDILSRVSKPERVRYLSLIGAHAEKKIFVGSKVDFFLSSALTDSIWVAHFNRKRGLAYLSTVANSDEHSHPKTYVAPAVYVQDEDSESKNWSTVNYTLNSDFIQWSFLNGIAQWLQQKKVGNSLHSFSTNDHLPISIIPIAFEGFRLKFECEEGRPQIFSVGDEAKNFNRTAHALTCLSYEYDFLVDAACSENASLELIVVGYGAGNRAEQHQLGKKGGEIQFSQPIDRFRVFIRIAGQGSIDFYGYRAQPKYFIKDVCN